MLHFYPSLVSILKFYHSYSFSAATGKSCLPGDRHRYTSNYDESPGLRCLCVRSVLSVVVWWLPASPCASHLHNTPNGYRWDIAGASDYCSTRVQYYSSVPSEVRDLGSTALNKADPPPPANLAIHRGLLLSPANPCREDSCSRCLNDKRTGYLSVPGT